MRGRRPTSTAAKKLAGNPGKRKLNAQEPTLPPGTSAFDTPPPELEGDPMAQAEWTRTAQMLRERRVITEGERGSLIALCQQWSIYQQAVAKWRTLGMIVKTPKGYPIINPYLGIANTALGLCTRLWAELGLTPSARSRVKVVETPAAGDPFAEFDQPLKLVKGGRA